ncbi:MAG: aminoacyl-tRNA deacylase [Deltaproteobacteria bacterium]|jgi:Cys-tRNA(Pro) deacylase|nr:aminoacyl-tRNA deacylase [Deltaproteobacteria bacterium]
MKNYPVTQAVRALKTGKIHFIPHLYPYEKHGGTHQAASILNVPEREVIKTLVMEADSHGQMLVLMHGDREVSTKKLARELGVKRVNPCDPISAEKHTGYKVGGISPFGTRKSLMVYVESSIMILGRIFVNGGKRGFMVEIDPCDLEKVLPVKKVKVAV